MTVHRDVTYKVDIKVPEGLTVRSPSSHITGPSGPDRICGEDKNKEHLIHYLGRLEQEIRSAIRELQQCE